MAVGLVMRPKVIAFKAAAHEVRCAECRVSWLSWFQRVVGIRAGYSPKPRKVRP